MPALTPSSTGAARRGVVLSAALALALCATVLAPFSTAATPVNAQVNPSCPGTDDPPTPTAVAVDSVPIVVDSTTADYFVLYVSHDLNGSTVEIPVLVKRGEAGTTTLAENVAALPAERYRVEKYLIADPADVDGDCFDDITELDNPGSLNPVNAAGSIERVDGAVSIPDRETFETLAHPDAGGTSHIKFVLGDMDTDRPIVYFQNTNTYLHHDYFLEAVNIGPLGDSTAEGTITYDPELVAPDGSPGLYYYTVAGRPSLRLWQRIYTLFAASMPLLDDNLALWISNRRLPQIQLDLSLYHEPRVNLVFDEDLYGESDFLALNPGEGYGLLRSLDPDERPHSRDVAIYEALPNELPRVAGIISTVPQTPLSHVNLRALQDGVPNAFIAGALEDDTISGLIDGYVHYAVADSGYSIRAATQAEVDDHHASSRPSEAQTPQRDLSAISISALSEIGFDDWDSFGVKAANVAVLGTLGFPEGTVPEGFAVPFYFYDEFMKHNSLYDDIEEMLADPDFQTDYDTKVRELKELRKKIKNAGTPDWIDTALTVMHATYAEGQSLRYRSSTNNEDLPNFNGAGLYDSNTQHPEETEEDGISKSLKQVFASLWNFRAFIERDFYRVDHLATAMGVLVHPNYSDERVNGVAVSIDPAYGTEGTYYVNSQLGEDLVTNPDAHSVPEEVLLYPDGTSTVVALSNQVPPGQLLMTDAQLEQLRRHLATIHERFAELYGTEDGEQFAIEIEFKITSDNILAIKQARPWIFTASPDQVDDTEEGALTARFTDAPIAHGGAPFSATIRFSESIVLGFEEFRDHAMTVTGGVVTNVRRLDRRSDRWEVDVWPDAYHTDAILVLADNRHCVVVGAICTADGQRLSNRPELVVQRELQDVDGRPVAVDDTASTNEDRRAVIDVLQNDSDPEGESLAVTIRTSGSNGLATVRADNLVTYTPDPNYYGGDSFTYTVSDGVHSATATVSVTILSVNDAPEFPAATAQRRASPNAQPGENVGAPVTATDVEGDMLTYRLTGSTLFEIEPHTAQITVAAGAMLEPAPAEHVVAVIATDHHGAEATVTVTVTTGRAPPRNVILTGGGGPPPGPSGPTPSVEDFEWTVEHDIEELDSGHETPSGMWSDSVTLWIAANAEGAGDAVYAYDLESGERVEEREFALDERNRAPRGVWSDRNTIWVADSGQNTLFAHDLETGELLPGSDIALASRNVGARGIWSADGVMWVLDGRADALFAYGLESGELLAEYALDAANDDPHGIWSDAVTIWVSDHTAKRLFAYRLPVPPDALPEDPADLERVGGEEFGASRELSRASNNSPRGLWSDGDVMYVADASDGKVYSYNMPDAIDARLGSLTLGGVDIGEFDSGTTEYAGVAAEGVTETTVAAEASQRRATVVIDPPDRDAEADGHQVALDGAIEIAVTVTSADGSREQVYRVRLGEQAAGEPTFDCFRGAVAAGFSLVVYGGGSLEEVEACAESRHITALYALEGGAFVSYILGAPEFVNRTFGEVYADGLPALTVLTARSEGPPTADPLPGELEGVTWPSCLRGEIVTGFSHVLYEGGSVEELEACARSLEVAAVYALDGGAFVSYILGAPEFVNRTFREVYAGGLSALAPLVVRSDGPPSTEGDGDGDTSN